MFTNINGCMSVHRSCLWMVGFYYHKPSCGVVALDCAIVSGCNQLVIGSIHACTWRISCPQMTDVHDIVQVTVVAPLGNSDHSSLSTAISMALAVPNLCASRKVFMKHRVN